MAENDTAPYWGVWGKRFLRLQEDHDFTDQQMLIVFGLLSEVRAFRFNHIEESAAKQLRLLNPDIFNTQHNGLRVWMETKRKEEDA
jgi:hypothetical protein